MKDYNKFAKNLKAAPCQTQYNPVKSKDFQVSARTVSFLIDFFELERSYSTVKDSIGTESSNIIFTAIKLYRAFRASNDAQVT